MKLEIKLNKITFTADIVRIIRMFLIAFVCILAIKSNAIVGSITVGLLTFFYLALKA